jgi:hypothetical protein
MLNGTEIRREFINHLGKLPKPIPSAHAKSLEK